MVIWLLDRKRNWRWVELSEEILRLGLQQDELRISPEVSPSAGLFYRWSSPSANISHYVLFSIQPGHLKVNGWPCFSHRVLHDKDEITLRGDNRRFTIFCSTESFPRIVFFEPSPGNQGTYCIRCKARMEAGQRAVCCPACRLWHHEMEGRACWSYDGKCAGCPRTTKMNFSWKPESMADRSMELRQHLRWLQERHPVKI